MQENAIEIIVCDAVATLSEKDMGLRIKAWAQLQTIFSNVFSWNRLFS